MKHSRHPLPWRVDAVRAGLLLGSALLGFSTPAWADKPTSAPEMETPTIGLPVVTPKMNVSTPAIPSFSLPTVAPVTPDITAQMPQMNASRRLYELKVSEYRRNPELHKRHPDRIEYAEALIHLERYEEAIEELEAIEEKYPDAYANAHLLGIACERSGNLPAASRWFAAAVERDPDAQEGTGWLRVAMIEAHIALREDPTWLSTHSVLDGCTNRSEGELVRAIEIQVEARRDLFASDDPILADLYFQVGIRMSSPEARNKFFALSQETGPVRKNDIDQYQVLRAKGPSPADASH